MERSERRTFVMEKRIPQAILLPRTEDSFPWGAADRQLVPTYLEKYGYEEEEYLYSGEADVYTLKDGQAQVKLSNAPYTNRFIIRKPKDPKKFSGNVVVELLNSTNSWDVSPMWCLLWQKMLHEGDIYVGVTVRAICTKTLKQYDTKRYEKLSWKNPNPNPGPVNHDILLWQHCLEDCEDGLLWDMLTQLGNLFKSGQGTQIAGKEVEKIYAISCSQSSMQLSTYINVFHETDRVSPVEVPYDGYLTYSGCRMVALNQEESPADVTDEIQKTRNCPVPVLRCVTQWDFKDFTGHINLRRADSDAEGDRFRLYELAGQAHNSFSGAFYRPGYAEIDQIQKTTGLPHTDITALPLEAFMRQALTNLDLWVREGIPAPHAQGLIEVDENNIEVLDENNNCKGGFRFPQLDVPVATYCSGTKKNDQDSCCVYFSEEKLKKLYPTRRDYIDKIFKAIDVLGEQRFFSVEDADQMKLDILKLPVPCRDHSSKFEG